MDSNENGQMGERLVDNDLKTVLNPFNITVINQKQFKANELKKSPTDSNGITMDKFISTLPRFPHGLCVSIKWSSEKPNGGQRGSCRLLEYELTNVIPACPKPVVLLLLGTGWKHKNSDWISRAKQDVDGIHFVEVFTNRDEFIEWLEKEVRKEPIVRYDKERQRSIADYNISSSDAIQVAMF